MWPNEAGILLPPENPDNFLKIAPDLHEIAEFDFVTLLNKDSTNFCPDDWIAIAQAIYDRRNEGYAGFVVAHGTDTMHFSSSAVSLALGKNLNVPVVFTGSQTDASVKHGDARTNLMRSFMVACSDLAEVALCFDHAVFRGARAQKRHESEFDAFESPAFPRLARLTKFVELFPEAKRRNPEIKDDIELIAEFAPNIVQISLIPGLETHFLNSLISNEFCHGVILQSFGAGNVPDQGPFSLLEFIAKASSFGKPVLVTSQFPANSTTNTEYGPGKSAVEAGAIPTGNMTSACAMVKFRWVLAQVMKTNLKNGERQKRIRELMNLSFVGELD